MQLKELTTLLENHQHSTHVQWQEACTTLDNIVNKISETNEKTYTAIPLPNLTNRKSQQGGFLPRKLAREWKRHLTTYHLIRKTIYIAQHDPHLTFLLYKKRNPTLLTNHIPIALANTIYKLYTSTLTSILSA